MVGFSEHSTERYGSVNHNDFSNKLTDHYLLKVSVIVRRFSDDMTFARDDTRQLSQPCG